MLFFILYGVTAMACFTAAVYLLLRRGNAFAADVTPPRRVRKWAASFFVMSMLAHVWWCLLFIYNSDMHAVDSVFSASLYALVVMLDCVTLLPTIAGTMLAMLQDRRRPVWPFVVGMIPFVVLDTLSMAIPDYRLLRIGVVYILVFFVLLTLYIAFAARQYGRWLRDNFADLERKEVWHCQTAALSCMLFFILYSFVDDDIALLYVLHVVELLFFGFLLWRVEMLPELTVQSQAEAEPEPETVRAVAANIDLSIVEKLLDRRCVATQLYLQHDLTLQQLARALGSNRYYLSRYFSSRGTSYNAYINDLRIRHFLDRYREAVANSQTITAQQLASESGYRSYSTFSLAFKQRMGLSVTAWMRQQDE